MLPRSDVAALHPHEQSLTSTLTSSSCCATSTVRSRYPARYTSPTRTRRRRAAGFTRPAAGISAAAAACDPVYPWVGVGKYLRACSGVPTNPGRPPRHLGADAEGSRARSRSAPNQPSVSGSRASSKNPVGTRWVFGVCVTVSISASAHRRPGEAPAMRAPPSCSCKLVVRVTN